MTISQHLNYPLTKIFYDRVNLLRNDQHNLPYGHSVNEWLRQDSALCQKLRECLRIGQYHVKHLRKDIQCQYLCSVFTTLLCGHDIHPSKDINVKRFDRIANLYEQGSRSDRWEIDRLFLCVTGLRLMDLLSVPLIEPTISLDGLTQREIDVGFGPEVDIFCEHLNDWRPAHLLPYRFLLSRTIETYDGTSPDDFTPSYISKTIASSSSLQTILDLAFQEVAQDRSSKHSIQVEYYGQDILIAANMGAGLQWMHPNAEQDDFPAYWRDEYPFDLNELMAQVMSFESKSGNSRTQERFFAVDLGL